MEGNGWNNYQQMVLHRLGRMENQMKEIEGRLHGLERRFWVLHTKVWVAGIVAGMMAAAFMEFALHRV